MNGLLLTLLMAAAPAGAARSEPPRERSPAPANAPIRPYAQSENFTVRSFSRRVPAQQLAALCEAWRGHLTKKWLSESRPARWQPRCQVVVHASRKSYQSSVGRHGAQTFGSSLTRRDRGRISERRIDLLVNADGKVTALPHELTHIVLAEAFPRGMPPAWLDEGTATLADTLRKQSLHRRDLHDAVQRRLAIRTAHLLTLERLSSDQRAAFYGQSVSLVSFLSRRSASEQLVPFAQSALRMGYDSALREHFDIGGIEELERLWMADVALNAAD